jgi:hypothetical protein
MVSRTSGGAANNGGESHKIVTAKQLIDFVMAERSVGAFLVDGEF